MIDRDVEPLFNVSPYRRIDPAHPGRKIKITRAEALAAVMVGRATRLPDAEAYVLIMDTVTGEEAYFLKEALPRFR